VLEQTWSNLIIRFLLRHEHALFAFLLPASCWCSRSQLLGRKCSHEAFFRQQLELHEVAADHRLGSLSVLQL
jgi:hypothetical protein